MEIKREEFFRKFSKIHYSLLARCPVYPNIKILLKYGYGLPWWCSGWESACHCRGHGFDPWSGKIPHAAEQLSLCATTTEPLL